MNMLYIRSSVLDSNVSRMLLPSGLSNLFVYPSNTPSLECMAAKICFIAGSVHCNKLPFIDREMNRESLVPICWSIL